MSAPTTKFLTDLNSGLLAHLKSLKLTDKPPGSTKITYRTPPKGDKPKPQQLQITFSHFSQGFFLHYQNKTKLPYRETLQISLQNLEILIIVNGETHKQGEKELVKMKLLPESEGLVVFGVVDAEKPFTYHIRSRYAFQGG